MKLKPFYITVTLPYVNSEPHIGYAMEIIRADVIARYKKLLGHEVFFNSGTDEHGQKVFQAAQAQGVDVQKYVDGLSVRFRDLKKLLNLSPDIHFVRTTDEYHVKAAQEFWKLCDKNGFIYKKHYTSKYCVGCELEKTDSELVEGKCPIHPNNTIELREEENYFFAFSKFQNKLLDLYAKKPDFVVPDFRFNEIKAFVERGLDDFSISRLASKMPWGVPVPGDTDHVMYVWFDALVSYISTLGWPSDTKNFEHWWNASGGVVQYCGKDNLRQQSAIWQAMLMAAGLGASQHIIINGFITAEGGVKMSKSLGNVVSPYDVVQDYGADVLRYYVCRELNAFEDSPFTPSSLKDAYNAGLANGIGNLLNRVMKMASSAGITLPSDAQAFTISDSRDFSEALNTYRIDKACDCVWGIIQNADKRIQDLQPFKLIKTDKAAGEKEITLLLSELYKVGILLAPLMPATSDEVLRVLKSGKMPEQPLFLRRA